MKRPLKHYFIPHFDNDFKPYLLREGAVFAIAVAVVFLFSFQYIYSTIVVGSDFFATILPGVIVDLTNADRALASAGPLSVNPVLNSAAQKKAEDMASKSYFAHTSPEGKTPWHWFSLAGYKFSYAGENLAVHFTESQDVQNAWLNSPGHRANILNKNFTEIGIGIAQGVYQGVSTTFVVEMFGRPTLAVAAASQTNPSPIVTPPPSVKVSPPPSAKPTPPPSVVAEVKNPPPPKIVVTPPSPTRVAVRDASAETPEFETIASNDMFVAVRNNEAIAAETAATRVGVQTGSSKIGSWTRRAMTSPRFVIDSLYALLAALVAIPLLLAIMVELERMHSKHIAYGVFLLFLITSAFYVSHMWLANQVTII